MLKRTKINRIGFVGKSTDLLAFLKHISTTDCKIKDIKQANYYRGVSNIYKENHSNQS